MLLDNLTHELQAVAKGTDHLCAEDFNRAPTLLQLPRYRSGLSSVSLFDDFCGFVNGELSQEHRTCAEEYFCIGHIGPSDLNPRY